MPQPKERRTLNPGKILFIDRDGVLHHDLGDYVKQWKDFKFIPGVLESLARLKQTGFQTVIVSNQAGVGDGLFSKDDLDKITRQMLNEIRSRGGEISAVYYCIHGKAAGCDCRKPKTGLFRQAAQHFHFIPSQTFFIGDKISDIKAGKDFGMRTIMVLTGYGNAHRQKVAPETVPDFTCIDFNEAVEVVLKHTFL